MIDFKVLPQQDPLTWWCFKNTFNPRAIALDGFVKEGPRWDENGPYANFNHHEGVDRLMTRATCAQVLLAIRQGLFDYFKIDGHPCATAYVNDCDEDVCTSIFILKNHHLVVNVMNPLLNRLVSIEDHMDTTAGAYPYPPDLPSLQESNWVFRPYRIFRLSGGLQRREGSEFHSIICDVNNRIMQYITGHGEKEPLDLRYKVLRKYKQWSMVEETGLNSKTGMFADAIRAYVTVRSFGDRWAYTIGRMSKFTDFDVPKLLRELSNEDDETWGGGDTIGGSNRAKGSKLSPDAVSEIITGFYE